MSVLGIIAALPAEARCFTGHRVRPRELIHLGNTLAYVSGVGENQARRAALQLLSQGAQALVSWGTAGALDPTLRPGALVIPSCLVSFHGQPNLPIITHRVDLAWHQRLLECLWNQLTVHTGPVLHSKHIVASPEEKTGLFSQTRAIAVDMESAAIAETATAAGIPFIVIRGIVDRHSNPLPLCTLKALEGYGNLRQSKLWWELLCHPTEISLLIRLAVNFRLALSTLCTVARIGGPMLGYK